MSATRELISALVAAGMDAADAAGLLARAAVEMTGALTKKSSGAVRQQRYRDRNKPSLSVTENEETEASRTVTNRNEASLSDTTSLSKEEKKESKKREGRASQLPDDWRPDAKHWAEAVTILGSDDRAERELRKFKLHAADKGRLAKNWNAAWVKWALQAIEYGARNGNGTSNHRADTAAGRATAREVDFVAAVGRGALQSLRNRKSAGDGWETQDGLGVTEIAAADEGPADAH